MPGVATEIDTASGALARAGGTARGATARGRADLVRFAGRAAPTAIAAVRARIDAARSAGDLAHRASAAPRGALSPGVASVVAASTVLGISSLVYAGSGAARQARVAHRFASTARANIRRLARRVTPAAMVGMAQGVDAGTGAVELAAAAHALSAAAAPVGCARFVAAAAVLTVAFQVQTAASAIGEAARARRRTFAKVTHLCCGTSFAASSAMSRVHIDTDALAKTRHLALTASNDTAGASGAGSPAGRRAVAARPWPELGARTARGQDGQ